MFESLQTKLNNVFDKLAARGRLTEEDVDTALREVRLALLEADVNFKVVKQLVARVRERAIGAEVMKSLTPAQQVVKIVHEELLKTLGEAARSTVRPAPHVIMLVGLQGSGKTTTAGKLALTLRKQGKRSAVGRGRHLPARCRDAARGARQADRHSGLQRRDEDPAAGDRPPRACSAPARARMMSSSSTRPAASRSAKR
jgi:hypothetical protein